MKMRIKPAIVTFLLLVIMAMPTMVQAAPIKLDLWYWVPDWIKILQPYLSEYQKENPQVQISVAVQTWNGYFDKIKVAANAGTGPAIFWMHVGQTQNMKTFMEPFPADRFPDSFWKQLITYIRVDGNVLFQPMGLSTYVMFRNTDYLAEAGIKVSMFRTWDEVKVALPKITRWGSDGNMTRAGLEINWNVEYIWNVLVGMLGGKINNEDGTAHYATEEGLRAYNMLLSLYDTGCTDLRKTGLAFAQGKAALTYSAVFQRGSFDTAKLHFDAQVMPSPEAAIDPIEGAGAAGGWVTAGLAVSKAASPEQKYEAFKLIRWLMDNQRFSVELSKYLAQPTPNPRYWPELAGDPIMRVALMSLEKAKIEPEPAPAASGLDLIRQGLLAGNESPISVLTRAEKEANNRYFDTLRK